VERARRHLIENARELGLRPEFSDLRLVDQLRSLTGDHVRFQQTVNDVPVFGALVSVSLPDGEHEPVVGSRYAANGRAPAGVSGGGPAAALESAVRQIGAGQDALAEAAEPALVYFPGPDKKLVPAWQLSVRTTEPLGSWLVLVDANTGAVLYRHNLLRFDSGQLFDPNPAQTNGGTPPAPHCDNGVNAALMTGEYVSKPLLGITAAQNKLKGPWVDTTAPGIFGGYKPAGVANEASRVYNYGCNDDRFEEVMVYYHLDRTQRKIQALGFTGTSGVLNRPVGVHAHYFGGCNAFFDPVNRGVHFGDFNDVVDCGGPPPLYDSAEDADVIVHEYGHAIQDDLVPGWSFGPFPAAEEAGAMGEGFGDFIAAVMNNDPCIGEYVSFGLAACGGAPGLRWLQNAMTYPGGYESCPNMDYDGDTIPESEEVHCGGLVWGGALWDMVEAIGGLPVTQQDRDIGLKLVLEAQFYLDQSATFNEAAAAVCLADSILYGGANAAVIASAFGGRGISTAPCAASDFASYFLRVLHNYSGDLDINVKVGPDVNTPLCSFSVADADFTLDIPNYYVGYDLLTAGSCSGLLPPTTGQPWWLEARDGFETDLGTIQSFEILLVGGTRCRFGGPPVPIPDGLAPGPPPVYGAFVYARVDCTTQSAPITPTPVPTPTPGPNAFGNVDCTGGINSIDALKVLRYAASLPVTQIGPEPDACPDIGVDPVTGGGVQGDVDCSGGVNAVNSIDALKLLRFAAGLPVTQIGPEPDGCPNIGT